MPRRRESQSSRNGKFADESSADEATAIAGFAAPPNYASTGTSERPSVPEEQEVEGDEVANSRVPEVKKGLFARFKAVELDNKGSTARDHLALERTFLAWLRTSLAFASIGVGISQLFRLNAAIRPSDPPQGYTTLRHMGKPLGITFLATAIAVLLIGVHRYYESQGWLLKGKFPASRGSIYLLTGIVSSLIITTLVIVLVVQPSHVEK